MIAGPAAWAACSLSAITVVVAWRLARRHPAVVHLAVMSGGLAVAGTTLTVHDPSRHGPLGYANASAAACVGAGAAAIHLGLTAESVWLRRAALLAAVLLLAMPIWFRSRAGAMGAAVVASALLPRVRRLGSHRVARYGASVVGITACATALVGWAWRPGLGSGQVAEQLFGSRAQLWHDAMTQFRDDPLWGAGAFTSGAPPVAAFQRFAHSALLHAAAVGGVLAAVTLVAVTAAVFAGLARSGTSAALIGCLAVTALGLQAGVDYVGHFVVVLASFAALVGAGLAAPPDRHTRSGP